MSRYLQPGRRYGCRSVGAARARPITKLTHNLETGQCLPHLPTQRHNFGESQPHRDPRLAVTSATAGSPLAARLPRSQRPMILPKERDPRFITIRRGGTLTSSDHRLLALWAATCAEHVLHIFAAVQPTDPRPREAIGHVRAWARGEVRASQSRAAGGHAMAAARALSGAARHAAFAAGQAAVVAHVAAHELGAAAYAIKASRAAASEGEAESAGKLECRWQREQLPDAIRELVIEDQRLRNSLCWCVFDC